MDVRFFVLEGQGIDEHEIQLVGSELLIGRSASCDLQIDHSRVSLEHCRISRRDDGRIVVQDLHSTYGTLLNGRDIELSALHDGDCVRIGPVVLLCAFGSEGSVARRRVLEEYATRDELRPSILAARLRDPNDDSPIVNTARQILERIAGESENFAEVEPVSDVDDPPVRFHGKAGRARIQMNEGVAHVNLLDRAIINDLDIEQIADELEALIRDGRRRILVDFGNVRQMSSQAVGVLIRAQKQLKAQGGLLKVCNPNPEVAEIFKITNLIRAIEIHVDEQAALRTGWPDTAPESAAAAAVASAHATLPADPRIQPFARLGADLHNATPVVRLVIEKGKSKGKSIPITGSKFVIGRDPSCQLRPASEAISRAHTRIEVRENKVFVRDLGTTNGTMLGGKLLLGEEAEAHNGEPLVIGPLAFTFLIESRPPMSKVAGEDLEDAAASWLMQGVGGNLDDTALHPLPVAEAAMQARQKALNEIRRLQHQVVGDVTVVTVLSTSLNDEEQIAPVRHELIALQNQPVPKRVVIRMRRVTEISSLAIAMLLGHFQRLDRLGGGLRLCELRDETSLPIEEAFLTSPVRIYTKVEDAVREPWPIT